VATSALSVGKLLEDATPAEIAGIRSPVCWALMVAVSRPLVHVPFDGALAANAAEAGGVFAWVSRDSSKPGRPGAAPETPECWVLHTTAEWSREHASNPKEAIAAALLAEFEKDFLVPVSDSATVVFSEAFRWNNAYPLNPLGLAPPCIEDANRRLLTGGDWAAGDRAGDAFESGAALAEAAIRMLD